MVLFIGLIGSWEDKILFSIFFYLNICVSVIIAQWQYYSCANILEKLVGYGKSLYSNDITLCRPAAKRYAIYTSFYNNRKTICLWTFLWNSSIYYYIFNGKYLLGISLIHALSSFIFCISAVHVKIQFPIFIQIVTYNSNHQQQHSFSMQYISFHAVI